MDRPSPDDPIPDDVPTLSEKLYDDLAKDIVNWQLLFDCDTRGVALTPGDSAEGPGLRAVFTACASDASPGDSGRVQVCQALVRSLRATTPRGKNLASRRRRPRATLRTPSGPRRWTPCSRALTYIVNR